ncbi:MAG: hypothetical protein WBN66_05335 [Smithella sp.]
MNLGKLPGLIKKTVFVFCFSTALVNMAHSAEFQKCLDQDGNTFLTNNPPPGAKCKSTGIEIIKSRPAEQEQALEKSSEGMQRNEIKQEKLSDTGEKNKQRTQNCVSCCTGKKQIFLNMNLDSRLAEALLEECVATCQSAGKTSSEWRDCWLQSDK